MTSSLSSPLRETALLHAHQKLGAKLVEFSGWNMPVMYTSISDEHKAVREAAGVFDISHMGEFFFQDKAQPGAARNLLNKLLTNDVAKLEIGQGQYTLMLNEQGGVIDDLIAYRIADDAYLLVVNAAKIEEDRAWVQKHLTPEVEFNDQSNRFSALALQGPKAMEITAQFFGTTFAAKMPKRNEITTASWNCQDIFVARTGYTGEDGVELIFSNEIAENFLFALLEAGQPLGLKPAGLGARDSLRLEAGLPLNGNDLAPTRSPLEAGLGFFVSLTKPDRFIGRDVLEKQKAEGTAEKLVAFRVLEGPPPRAHYAVFAGPERVGEVASGVPSPTLGFGIGLAYVRADRAALGTPLELEVRGRRVPIEIVKKPFYKRAN